jgi:hypothetical protein
MEATRQLLSRLTICRALAHFRTPTEHYVSYGLSAQEWTLSWTISWRRPLITTMDCFLYNVVTSHGAPTPPAPPFSDSLVHHISYLPKLIIDVIQYKADMVPAIHFMWTEYNPLLQRKRTQRTNPSATKLCVCVCLNRVRRFQLMWGTYKSQYTIYRRHGDSVGTASSTLIKWVHSSPDDVILKLQNGINFQHLLSLDYEVVTHLSLNESWWTHFIPQASHISVRKLPTLAVQRCMLTVVSIGQWGGIREMHREGYVHTHTHTHTHPQRCRISYCSVLG